MSEEEPVLKHVSATAKTKDSRPYHLVNLPKKQSRFKPSTRDPNESEYGAINTKARDSHFYHLSNLEKKAMGLVPVTGNSNESVQITNEEEPILKARATTTEAGGSHLHLFAPLRKKSSRFLGAKADPNESEHNMNEEEEPLLKDGAKISKARDSHPYHFANLRKKKTHYALAKEHGDKSEIKLRSTATLKEVRFENEHKEIPEKKPEVSNSPKQDGSQSKVDTATSEGGSNGSKPGSASHVPKSAGGKCQFSTSKPKSASSRPTSSNDLTDLEESKPSSSKATPSVRGGASTSSDGQHDAGTLPSSYRTTFETWQPGKQKVVCPKCHQLMVPVFRRSKNLADTIFKPSCLMSCWPFVLLPFVNHSGLGQIRMFCVNCKSLIGVFNPDKGMFEDPPDCDGAN